MSDLAEQIRRCNSVTRKMTEIDDMWMQHCMARKFTARLDFLFQYTEFTGNVISPTATAILIDLADLGDALLLQPRQDMI